MNRVNCIIRALVLLAALALLSVPSLAQGIRVTVDGQAVSFAGQSPVLRGGTVLVPLRGVFEKLGASVNYDAPAKRVVATKGETAVVLVIGSDTAYINGDPKKLLLPALVMNGSTMVPLRFVSEALGAQVAWKAAAQTVEIITQATNAGNLPSAPGTAEVSGRVTGVFPQLNPPLVTLMVNGENTQVTLAPDVVVLVNLPDGRSLQMKLSDIRRGDQITVKRDSSGRGVLVVSSFGETSGTLKSVRALTNGNYLITLDDGTTVEMASDAPITMAGQPVAIGDVHPGERVVIRVNPQTRIAYGMAVATGGEGTPTPPAAVRVTSFNIAPTVFLKAGDTLSATLVGTPRGIATFEIPGVKGAEAVPMTESPAGTYKGSFKVPSGVSVRDANVLGTLKVGNVSAPTIQTASTISIDAVGPMISGLTPANGDTVTDRRPLIYATIGDAGSDIGRVAVTLDGTDVSSKSTVTPQFFNFRPDGALAVGDHTVVVRVFDKAGNVTEATSKFTVSESGTTIKNIAIEPAGPYNAGDNITVTATAQAGGKAWFNIGDTVKSVPMTHQGGGRYKGFYKIKSGDSVEKAPLTVRFRSASGEEVTATGPTSITINAGAPAAPVIMSPVEGAAVESPVVITGKAKPNSRVLVSVGYSGQLLVLPVEGTVADVEVKAGADGVWKTQPIELAKPAGVSKLQYQAVAVVTDASGQESEAASVGFKRK